LRYEQLERFAGALAQVDLSGIKPEIIHAANSAASEWLPEAFFDAIRTRQASLQGQPRANCGRGGPRVFAD
jgi:alanine racemase